MDEIKATRICKCDHCGNEAEMVVTCSLQAHDREMSDHDRQSSDPGRVPRRVKGTAACSHCGNEAEMWIDL